MKQFYPCKKRVVLLYTSFLVLFSGLSLILKSQITLTSFPKDYQLYPRDIATNKATINIAGTVSKSTGYTQVRIKRYRDGDLENTTRLSLVYINGTASFQCINQITAELKSYKFVLYGYKNSRETQITSVNNVVAGDAYIIQGQSNATANLRGVFSTANNADDPSNSPYRNWVRVYGNGSATQAYTHAWFIGKGNVYYDQDGHCGQWGMRMASAIAGAKKIPIALFNGSSPGQAMYYFQRNDANPIDATTNYGRLFRRIQEAGLANNIRGVIWFQGESDIVGSLSPSALSTDQYKTAFNNLKADWKADYPSISKYYIFQIRFGCGMSSADNCLVIQEAQRQLDLESNEIQTIAVSNTNQLFDGGSINYCHYNFYDGYKSMGDWMANLIRRDLYNDVMPATVNSPEPESVSYSGFLPTGQPNQISITLKDQSGSFIVNGNCSPLFRLDGGDFTVTSVSLSGRTLLVNFTRNAGTTGNPSSISYRSHDNLAAPVITNNAGLALIHFNQLPLPNIGTPPPNNPTICADDQEPNNSFAQYRSISVDKTYTGSISSATDEDWLRFRTWSPWRYLKVSLWGLPANYAAYLYDESGNLLASSYVYNSSTRILAYNNGANDVFYRLKIASLDGSFDPSVCYSVRVSPSSAPIPGNVKPYASRLSSPPAGSAERESIAGTEQEKQPAFHQVLTTYPNPARETLVVDYPGSKREQLQLTVLDMAGRELIRQSQSANNGPNRYQIAVGKLAPGTYLLQIRSDDGQTRTRKFMIGSR